MKALPLTVAKGAIFRAGRMDEARVRRNLNRQDLAICAFFSGRSKGFDGGSLN
jgi:hypothetical protein